jgi:hypothetical protein
MHCNQKAHFYPSILGSFAELTKVVRHNSWKEKDSGLCHHHQPFAFPWWFGRYLVFERFPWVLLFTPVEASSVISGAGDSTSVSS